MARKRISELEAVGTLGVALAHPDVKCSVCGVGAGGQHLPSCQRQGIVTADSDYGEGAGEQNADVDQAANVAQADAPEAAGASIKPLFDRMAVVLTDCPTPRLARERILSVLAITPGGTEQERCAFVCGAWETWILMHNEGVLKGACPTFKITAAIDEGMRMMIALSHWAAAQHDLSADVKREFRAKVREFEMWREANK